MAEANSKGAKPKVKSAIVVTNPHLMRSSTKATKSDSAPQRELDAPIAGGSLFNAQAEHNATIVPHSNVLEISARQAESELNDIVNNDNDSMPAGPSSTPMLQNNPNQCFF